MMGFWVTQATRAQMVATGDGTTATDSAIVTFVKDYFKTMKMGDVGALRNMLYFNTNIDLDHFNKTAPIWSGMVEYMKSAPKHWPDVTRVDIVAHPIPLGTGRYTFAVYYAGAHTYKYYPLKVIVQRNKPKIVFDELDEHMVFANYDEDYNTVLVFHDGTKGYGPLDQNMMERLRAERDIARWNAVKGEALALRAERFTQETRDTIAMIDYSMEHGAAHLQGAEEVRRRFVALLQERERMTPAALRTQAVTELQQKVDKLKAIPGGKMSSETLRERQRQVKQMIAEHNRKALEESRKKAAADEPPPQDEW